MGPTSPGVPLSSPANTFLVLFALTLPFVSALRWRLSGAGFLSMHRGLKPRRVGSIGGKRQVETLRDHFPELASDRETTRNLLRILSEISLSYLNHNERELILLRQPRDFRDLSATGNRRR